LAENPKVSVLVIEAGVGYELSTSGEGTICLQFSDHFLARNPREIPEITTPARAFELRDSEYDWAYKTTFIDRPEYTRLEKPNTRGKVLGGSSCLNYYTWVPGSKATFDDWAAFGGSTWTWENCEKYFRKVEHRRHLLG
jgi:choline dehydrogenase